MCVMAQRVIRTGKAKCALDGHTSEHRRGHSGVIAGP